MKTYTIIAGVNGRGKSSLSNVLRTEPAILKRHRSDSEQKKAKIDGSVDGKVKLLLSKINVAPSIWRVPLYFFR